MLPILLSFLAVTVPTAQYNNQRTGANVEETTLTPRNVNAASFGKLYTLPVDGDVYAQPLYIPGLPVVGSDGKSRGVHNVVFVATEHNSVYAFDAGGEAAPLWHVNFGVAVRSQAAQCSFIAPEIGITPTPAIDPATRTMYVLARTAEQGRYYQRLHAIDITTGAEKPGSPVLIRATVKGSGLFGLGSRDIGFHAVVENPRAAMLLDHGTVYIAWGSACDAGPYYGWLLAYDARTLRQTGVFNTAPEAGQSGIWQADAGIAADEQGNVYAVTGNGKFTAAGGGRDYGDSVIKLRFGTGGNPVRDFFTPFDESSLNNRDDDLGSSGPVLLPDHRLVVAGKAGTIYLIDRDHMGGFHAGSDSHAVQTIRSAMDGAFGAPAYWNGHLFYFGDNDVLKDFAVRQGRLSASPVRKGAVRFKAAAIPQVSANGDRDGIVWIVLTKAWNERRREGELLAWDAGDVSRQLISLKSGSALRFTMPLIADGRVYVAAQGTLLVFGLFKH